MSYINMSISGYKVVKPNEYQLLCKFWGDSYISSVSDHASRFSELKLRCDHMLRPHAEDLGLLIGPALTTQTPRMGRVKLNLYQTAWTHNLLPGPGHPLGSLHTHSTRIQQIYPSRTPHTRLTRTPYTRPTPNPPTHSTRTPHTRPYTLPVHTPYTHPAHTTYTHPAHTLHAPYTHPTRTGPSARRQSRCRGPCVP